MGKPQPWPASKETFWSFEMCLNQCASKILPKCSLTSTRSHCTRRLSTNPNTATLPSGSQTKRVNEILNDGKQLEILGKKVYPIPAHSSLLEDLPKLGKGNLDVVKDAAKLIKEASEPPSKKIKIEKDDEEEDEDEEDEGEEGEDEENGEEADDDDEEEDDDEDDAESD